MKNKLRYLAILACLALAIIAGSVLTKYEIHQATDYKYYQVFILNRDYRDELRVIHCPYPVEDHDWEEAAHSLGMPVDCLSIATYLDHLSK